MLTTSPPLRLLRENKIMRHSFTLTPPPSPPVRGVAASRRTFRGVLRPSSLISGPGWPRRDKIPFVNNTFIAQTHQPSPQDEKGEKKAPRMRHFNFGSLLRMFYELLLILISRRYLRPNPRAAHGGRTFTVRSLNRGGDSWAKSSPLSSVERYFGLMMW